MKKIMKKMWIMNHNMGNAEYSKSTFLTARVEKETRKEEFEDPLGWAPIQKKHA